MQYKTMVLELLQERSEIYDRLRRQRMLLPTMEFYARELKDLHEAWKDHLSQSYPGKDPSQIASEALEIALKELVDSLPSASAPEQSDHPSVEDFLAFLRDHMPAA